MDTDLRVRLDQKLDCIPFVSLASNLIVLFEKYVFIPRMDQEALDPYYRYIQQKSLKDCLRFAIPLYGNFAAYYHHFRKSAPEPTKEPIPVPRSNPVLRNPQLDPAQQGLLQEARMNYSKFFARTDLAAQVCQTNSDFLLALITPDNCDLVPIPGMLRNDRHFGIQVFLRTLSRLNGWFAETFASLMRDEEFLLDALTLLTNQNVPFFQLFVRRIDNDMVFYHYLAKDERLFDRLDPAKHSIPFLRKAAAVSKERLPDYKKFGTRLLTRILDDQALVSGPDATRVAQAFTQKLAFLMSDPGFHDEPLSRVTKENVPFFRAFVAGCPKDVVCAYLKKDANFFDDLPDTMKKDFDFCKKALHADRSIIKKIPRGRSLAYDTLTKIADRTKWLDDDRFFNTDAPEEDKKDPEFMLQLMAKPTAFSIVILHPDLFKNPEFLAALSAKITKFNEVDVGDFLKNHLPFFNKETRAFFGPLLTLFDGKNFASVKEAYCKKEIDFK